MVSEQLLSYILPCLSRRDADRLQLSCGRIRTAIADGLDRYLVTIKGWQSPRNSRRPVITLPGQAPETHALY